MKISNKIRDERIQNFIGTNFEAPLIRQKYIKLYEVVLDDEGLITEFLSPEDICIIAEEVGPGFSCIIADAIVDMKKLSKDTRKTTDSIIKSVLKKA